MSEFSVSSYSRKLSLSRKNDTIYKRSFSGFSLRRSKVLSFCGRSLKWSKSMERNSRKANEVSQVVYVRYSLLILFLKIWLSIISAKRISSLLYYTLFIFVFYRMHCKQLLQQRRGKESKMVLLLLLREEIMFLVSQCIV